MADRVSIVLDGFDQFVKPFSNFPIVNLKRAVRKSLSKTATVLLKAAKQNALALNHRNTSVGRGFLRIPGSDAYMRIITRRGKTIRTIYRPLGSTLIKKVGVDRRTGIPYAIVGPESRTAPHANLVEFGTSPHSIPLARGGMIRHPGSRPQPFLRNAFLSNRAALETKLATELRKDIDVEIDRLAKAARATK